MSMMGDVEQPPFGATVDGGIIFPGRDEYGFPVAIIEDEEEDHRSGFSTRPKPGQVLVAKKPSVIKRELTEVSKCYDRHGKGFLDDAERALRSMDYDNKGYLEPKHVFLIMESLQREQRQSAELIDAIRKEHKRSVSLRRAVVFLSCFTILLALSNIGTSFVAARLAKDMQVNLSNSDLVSMNTGERLGTTSKALEISVTPVLLSDDKGGRELTAQRRRHLADVQSFVCGTNGTEGVYTCEMKGVITFTESVKMYREFCPKWPNINNTCQGGGVAELLLNCNGRRSTVFGGSLLPPTGPTIDTFGYEYMIFPTQYASYQAQQALYNISAGGGGNAFQTPCIQDFQMGFYCPTSGVECFVFADFDARQCPGLKPELC